MQIFKKATLLLLVLCLAAGLMPSTIAAEPEETTETTAPATEETTPTEEAYDPYIFHFGPSEDLIPDYYEFYAKPFLGNSPHYIYAHNRGTTECCYVFNVVNMSALIEDEALAPQGGYASAFTYCADIMTKLNYGAVYRRLNLENGYFCLETDGIDLDIATAEKLRAVLNNTFPALQDAAQMESTVNAYLTETYGDDAVLVTGLTGAEWVTASQCAVWHFTNGMDYSAPFPYDHAEDFDSWSEWWCEYYYSQMMDLEDPINIREKQSDTTISNISGVYEYLVNLPGEKCKDIIITESSFALVGAIKRGTPENHDLIVLIDINGTIDADDCLTLTASYGGQTQTFDLGATSTLAARRSGLYAITFEGVSDLARSVNQLVLEMNGSQTVHDICFYEAKPAEGMTARDTVQNMTGFASGAAPVYCAAAYAIPEGNVIEICKVDSASGNPLPGVAFDLYVKLDDGDLKLETYVTDADGKIAVEVSGNPADYYFVESAALPGYSAVDGSFAGGTVENSHVSGALEISKKVVNASAAQDWEHFDFKVTLNLTDAPLFSNNIDWMDEEYAISLLESSKDLTWTVSGDNQITAEFTLHADESITIDCIPLGAVYTVEEVLTEESRTAFSVSAEVTAGDGEAADAIVRGSIGEENAVLYTNAFFEIVETTVPATTVPETTVPRDVTNPSTGDSGMDMMIFALLLSAAATMILLQKRRFL